MRSPALPLLNLPLPLPLSLPVAPLPLCHNATRKPLPAWCQVALVVVLVLGLGLSLGAGLAHAHPSKVRASVATGHFAQHEPALAFARALDEREGWSDGWAQHWIRAAERNDRVIRLMTPAAPGTPRNWNLYRERMVDARRVQAGLNFWRTHQSWLQKAETEFGVPAWLIVGIIGVETLYGQHMGTFRVLDALATLAFHFPPEHPRAQARATFFAGELEALLRKSRASGTAPSAWRGSFAGAIGLPQFMPSNWSRYGVDFDADGRVDLIHSAADAIGSVARYLQAFGWQSGMPTHFPVQMDASAAARQTLLAPSILPTFSPQAMHELGARLDPSGLGHEGLLALVELPSGDPAQGGQATGYVAGTTNFYAITRYNQSSFYALAVIQLGLAVEALWKR